LRYHLGLLRTNSPDRYIIVDGQTFTGRMARALMLDETYIHRARTAPT